MIWVMSENKIEDFCKRLKKDFGKCLQKLEKT